MGVELFLVYSTLSTINPYFESIKPLQRTVHHCPSDMGFAGLLWMPVSYVHQSNCPFVKAMDEMVVMPRVLGHEKVLQN